MAGADKLTRDFLKSFADLYHQVIADLGPRLAQELFERLLCRAFLRARAHAGEPIECHFPENTRRRIAEELLDKFPFRLAEESAADGPPALDPEILGITFESVILPAAKTSRRRTGSYYTPRPLVQFMCRQALQEYLAGQLAGDRARERIGCFLVLPPDDDRAALLSEAEAERLHRAVLGCRVCDPAMGCGAFLIGMLHELTAALVRLDRRLHRSHDLLAWTRHIVTSCLYGVDLLDRAVRIGQIRLALALVAAGHPGRDVPLLPQLDRHLRTGDSLHDGMVFAEDSGEKVAFDIVIGNPPYVSALELARSQAPDYRDALRRRFTTARGAYDLYVPFFEQGLAALRPGGILAYLTPNKWLSARYATALRRFLRQHGTLLTVADVSGLRIFQEAAVYPVVAVIRAGSDRPVPVTTFRPRQPGVAEFRPDQLVTGRVPPRALARLPEGLLGFVLSDHAPLLARLLEGATPLARLGKINATTTAGEAEAYGRHLADRPGPHALKVVNTGTIDPFRTLWGTRPLIHAGRRFLTPYLAPDRAALSPRRRSLYAAPKVIFAKMARAGEAFLDGRGEYAALNCNCFYEPAGDVGLEYVCGFCNSRLFRFLYNQLFGALRMSGGYFPFQAPQLRVVPVKAGTARQRRPVADLVRSLTRDGPDAADFEDRVATLDRLFYHLYGLTDRDVRAVEGIS